MKTSPSRNALLGVLGSTAALSALIAVALARGGDRAEAPAAPSARPSSSAAGLTVAKDPETGQLRAPTAEEMAALQSSAAGPKGAGKAGALKVERLPNGAVVTTLDESYTLYSVASVDTDGKVRRACVPSDRLDTALEAKQKGNQTTAKEASNEK